MEPAELDALIEKLFLTTATIDAKHPANICMRDFPSYGVFYEADDDSADAEYTHLWLTRDDPDTHLLQVVNDVIIAYVEGTIPFVVYISAESKDVRIALLKETARPVYVYRGYDERIGTLAHVGDELALPYVAKDLSLAVMPSSVFVPEDVVVMHVHATLFRKPPSRVPEPGADLPKPFETEESLVLPAGTYASVEAIAEALNGAIRMRGERNGPVYVFMKSKKRRGVLRLAAHHRQPDPSFIVATPSEAGLLLGLAAPARLVLGNKKYVDFHGLPCGLVI
jgi:hypothetical protein